MLRYSAFMVCGALIGWCVASAPLKAPEDSSHARPLPTTRQARIRAALDEPSELDYGTQRLQDVVDYLARKHEIAIELDQKPLREMGVDGDTPITFSINEVTLRSLLELVLGELDLTYLIADGYLLITTKNAAAEKLYVQVYPIDDLVTAESDFRAPLLPRGKAGNDYQNLINAITGILAPTTWDDVGGPCSLTVHPNSGGLAVSQTDEVHEEIASLLANLRRVRDKQFAAAHPHDRFTWGRRSDAQHKGELEIRLYRFFRLPLPGAPANAPQPPPGNGAAGATAADTAAAEANRKAAEIAASEKLDAWTNVIVKLAPEMIAPESWKPAGEGQIRAVSGTIVVHQTPDVQVRVARLIYEMMLPGLDTAWYPLASYYGCNPPVRLSPPPITTNWPQEAEPPPSEAESGILAAFAEDCDLDFTERPLNEVIAAFSRQTSVDIRIDQHALAAAGVASDTPITRGFHGITLKNALKLILDELDLAYVVRNEVLLVTSKEEAANFLVAKVYPVFDLVVRRPEASSRLPAIDFDSLIHNIIANVAPTTWDEVGGPCAIHAFTNAGALVILQTPERHEQIAALLRALREVAAASK